VLYVFFASPPRFVGHVYPFFASTPFCSTSPGLPQRTTTHCWVWLLVGFLFSGSFVLLFYLGIGAPCLILKPRFASFCWGGRCRLANGPRFLGPVIIEYFCTPLRVSVACVLPDVRVFAGEIRSARVVLSKPILTGFNI